MIVENVFDCPPVQHVPMEPHVCVAEWRDGRLTLWDSTQAPNWVADRARQDVRVPPSDVRVIVPTLGGGYGAKIDPSIEPIAALLARKARRPVRLALHRDEEFLTHTKHGARVRIRTGVKRDGTLVAHQATCWYNGGAYAKETPEKITRGYASMGRTASRTSGSTRTASTRTSRRPRAFRGFGIPQVSLGARVADGRARRRARASTRWSCGCETCSATATRSRPARRSARTCTTRSCCATAAERDRLGGRRPGPIRVSATGHGVRRAAGSP